NDDHYAAFNSVHNTETSEPHRPSLVIALESADHVPKGLLINTKRQEFGLIENEMNYTCDSLLVSEDHILYNKLFVREKITCELPIELAYYSSISHRQGLKQLCYWCGVDGSFADPQENLVEIKTNKKKEVEVTMFNLTIGRKKSLM
ncbi:15134_t:CDS:2, partial [Rhizophagus irregularis]